MGADLLRRLEVVVNADGWDERRTPKRPLPGTVEVRATNQQRESPFDEPSLRDDDRRCT